MSNGPWTDEENDLIVADYFAMLVDDLAGKPFNKAASYRQLADRINRSAKAIEYKHQNISAVLKALGETWLTGLAPAFNFQGSLEHAVLRWFNAHPEWLLRAPTPRPPSGLREAAQLWIGPPPTLSNQPPPQELEQMLHIAHKFDVAGRDERNRALGRAGEERVLAHERAALRTAGRDDLARKVRWVSEEDGDGAGYDIASFAPDGLPRLIEVKTTNGWERTPFHITRNELAVAEERRSEWRLFRLWNFSREPKAFELHPPLDAHVSLGAVSLAALVRHLCLRAGLAESLIDVSGLWGAVEGYVIGALESPRASISTLARHFGFDAIETEGVIRFVMRGRPSSLTLTVDDLAASREGEAFELTRGQETELPQALKWQVARADEDYDAALVEARRITVDTTRIASESFPMAIPPEEAERRCRRALMEAWIGRESATFRLPPSRLSLDPADVIRLAHDGREVEFRLVSVADAEARGIEAVRQDRAAYDLPPGDPRPASLASPVVFGTPDAVMLDLPQITEDQPAHRPLIAAHASPWPGEIAVFRSASTDGFNLLTTIGSRARIGALAFDFFPGPTSRFDLGNALVVDLLSGTLESVTDVALFGGGNALAVESAVGQWEIVQAGQAELIAPGRYRLTRLLRGQRGTEHAMGNPAPAGARVVVLDTTLASLPIAEADLGLPWNWRVGPAARTVSDASYAALSFTPTGRGLVPFAPVHVEQPWRIARSPGDLTIRWARRSRALVADAWEQVEVPLAEDLESYDVQILDGAIVKRTLTGTTTSVLYTAAQQTADWGAPLGPGQTLAIRIYQLSNRLGRGAPSAVTLQF